MFIRSKMVKGRTYYQLVGNRRVKQEGGGPGPRPVRQKVILSLGTHPTIEAAFRAAEARYYEAPRPGGRRGALAAAKAWDRLEELAAFLEQERDAKRTDYHGGSKFRAEWRRRHGRMTPWDVRQSNRTRPVPCIIRDRRPHFVGDAGRG